MAQFIISIILEENWIFTQGIATKRITPTDFPPGKY